MKKFIYFLAGALMTLSATALAATFVFTDQNSFTGSWFENAAVAMQEKEIVLGYPDGSFGPSNQVNRAELVVMLDRFEKYLSAKIDNKTQGDQISPDKLSQVINNTLKYTDEPYSYYLNFVVLAESELILADGPPKEFSSGDMEEVTDAILPNGYTLYEITLFPSAGPYYLYFGGQDCSGDICYDKQQWYGPFYRD